MATTALGTVLDNLRRSSLRQDGTDLTDGELLECFITRRDEAAFEALLRRHGPMVLGVCRRVLRNEADAEDAFQATFLVLVRKAASLRTRGLVGNWLYGVAHTTALKARAMSTKRSAKEREAARRLKPEAAAETQEPLQALLDQQLKALPDIYRAAVVLCDLEGKSIKEAARQLGCPPGTVGTRLARGRNLLARRLSRSGLAFSGGTLAAALARQATAGVVSPPLMNSTVQAASGVTSANVAALAEGVLKAMFLTQHKIATGVLLAVAAVAVGLGALAHPAPAQKGDRPDGPKQGGHQPAPQQLSQEVRAAWQKAGAEISDDKDTKVPLISFSDRPAAGFAKLPVPEVPVILELYVTWVTADDFKDLAGLKTVRELRLRDRDRYLRRGQVQVLSLGEPTALRGLGALAALPDLRALRLEALDLTEAAYAEVAVLKRLREVRLTRTRLTDAGLTHLGTLPELEVFSSSGSSGEQCEARAVTAAGVKGLAAAPRLVDVSLYSFPLDDEGFKQLAGLKDLRALDVYDRYNHAVTVSDEGMKSLAGAAKLSRLRLTIARGRITDEGVKHLAGLKELTSLEIRYAEVTDEGVKHLAGLKNLRSLDLSATAVSDAGLEHLRGLTNLVSLDLRGNGSLTAAGLKPLHELKRLETLELTGTKTYGTPAREEHLAELRKALPRCTIDTRLSYTDP